MNLLGAFYIELLVIHFANKHELPCKSSWNADKVLFNVIRATRSALAEIQYGAEE